MKKFFISQPMRNLSDEEIKKERNRIFEHVKTMEITNQDGSKYTLENEDIKLIDSFFEGAPHDVKPLWFLGESFKKLAEADIVYFGGDWKNARGCKMEHEATKQYLSDVLIIEE